ncbi:MAG TPA: TetR/AcrR family transcriptional regulator [Vicinamibacterales bacterium]|jgi:AcrR family transcriptional regulator|nr:TetR/AcrR family transcriptional regulator [Vicinamibacterales bacterium]
MKTVTRAYQQTVRAERATANGERIVEATAALLETTPRVRDVTLDAVAERAGVTVRTILRRFATRDGLLEAAFHRMGQNIGGNRPLPPAGDVDAAVESLTAQYERFGEFILKMLEQEHDLPVLSQLVTYGRSRHRAWLEQVFAPQLASLGAGERKQRITELYAATDVYLWKLFRRDFRLTRKQTAESFHNLITAVLTRRQARPSPAGGSR